MGEQIREWK